MANSDQDNAIGSVFATARECGFAWIDLDHLSIAALLGFLKQSGYLVSRTVLTINNQAQRTVKQTLSGIYGKTSFPYHTDYSFLPLPPRFIILSNDSTSCFGRSTFVTRFDTIPADMARLLRTSQWLLTTRRGAFLLSSTQLIGGGEEVLFRWDLDVLVPYNNSARQSMTCIPSCFEQNRTELSWRPRSAVLINNWRCAHARGGVVSIGDDLVRRLIRYEVWTHA